MSSPAHTIGIAGLGLVGQALARRLRGQGYAVAGYDVRESACKAFAESGGRAVDSVEALAQAVPRMLIAVFEDAQLLDVARTVADAPQRACKTIIGITTVLPATLQQVAKQCAAAGIELVEAPMSGSSEKIANGEGVMFVGGEDSAVAHNEDVLAALTPHRKRIGAAGSASAAKLSTNLVLGLNRAAVAEGMALAESLGIDRKLYLDLLIDSAATSRAAREKGPLMAADNYTPPVATVTQHAKDVRLMLELGKQTGQALPLTELHRDLLQRSIDRGDAELDNAAVIRVWTDARKPN